MNDEFEKELNNLPKSVSVISWLLIIISIIGFLVILGTSIHLSIKSNIRLESTLLFILTPAIFTALQVGIGIGMLKGNNLARKLFFGLIPISIITTLAFSGGNIVPVVFLKIGWYLIFVYFLTRPNVSSYFTDKM